MDRAFNRRLLLEKLATLVRSDIGRWSPDVDPDLGQAIYCYRDYRWILTLFDGGMSYVSGNEAIKVACIRNAPTMDGNFNVKTCGASGSATWGPT